MAAPLSGQCVLNWQKCIMLTNTYDEIALGPTVYLYDGINLLGEVDSSGNVLTRYTQGPNVDEPVAQLRSGSTSNYEPDGLGSVTSLSSPSGTIQSTYAYDSFGNLSTSTGSLTNPFRYTARELDSETSLYYYRARYYDPQIGRFVSEDPIGFGGGLNFYGYARSNPILFIDPLGLRWQLGGPQDPSLHYSPSL